MLIFIIRIRNVIIQEYQQQIGLIWHMLRYENFNTLPAQQFTTFVFSQLIMSSSSVLDESKLTYTDNKGNLIRYEIIDSLQEVRIIQPLARNKALINYKGVLSRSQKQLKFWIFYSHNEFQNLANLVNKPIQQKQEIDQKFCIQYFQSFANILNQFQKNGIYIKIINLNMIGMVNLHSDFHRTFGLLMPFACRYFNCVLRQEYQQNITLLAPQIIRYFTTNRKQELCQKQFRKAALYSLGLNLLACFGYVFNTKQRIEAAKNDKQFRVVFKKIRKQIKVMHNGKFVTKSLKLLLEDCQKSRQTLQTFAIKIRSDQFASLKIFKGVLNTNENRHYSTICQSNKSQIYKSQNTISIQVNQYNTSPLNLSPLMCKGNNSDKPKNFENQNSPINIQVNYDDQNVSKSNKDIEQTNQNCNQIVYYQLNKQIMNMQEKTQVQLYFGEHDTENQIYNYSKDQINLNKNNMKQFDLNQNEIPQENYKILNSQFSRAKKLCERKKLQFQNKIILAIMLIGFFLYGIIGYLRQCYQNS